MKNPEREHEFKTSEERENEEREGGEEKERLEEKLYKEKITPEVAVKNLRLDLEQIEGFLERYPKSAGLNEMKGGPLSELLEQINISMDIFKKMQKRIGQEVKIREKIGKKEERLRRKVKEESEKKRRKRYLSIF